MDSATPVFVDGLGRRIAAVGDAGGRVEHLLFDPALVGQADFMRALADHVTLMQGRRLTAHVRVHRLEVHGAIGATLVSDYVPAWRLADVLDVAETENLTFDVGVALLLLRQLIPTATLVSRHAREAANGALGPEHLLLLPQGRVVLTDYVFGPAIDALQWVPERLWRTLRVAVPAGSSRAVSQRGDVLQVGLTLLSLILGRRLRDDEYPDGLDVLVQSARQRSPGGVDAPLSPALRDWLLAAVQRGEKTFATLFEAQSALERVLATDATLLAQPAEIDLAMSRFARFMPPFDTAPPADLLMEAPPPDLVPMAMPREGTAAHPVKSRRSKKRSGARAASASWAPVPRAAEDEPAADPPWPHPPPVAPTSEADAEFNATEIATELASDVAPDVDVYPSTPLAPFTKALPTPLPPAWPVAATASTPWWRSGRVVVALMAMAAAQAGVIGWLVTRPSDALGGDGELVVHSQPSGAAVLVDDRVHGATPLTVRISPGTHVLQVRAGNTEPRVIPLVIRAGTQTAQYVELIGVATTGMLEVRSDPGQATVSIDGSERGATPLTLRDLAPGEYRVVIARGSARSSQVVRVEPGSVARLVVALR